MKGEKGEKKGGCEGHALCVPQKKKLGVIITLSRPVSAPTERDYGRPAILKD